MTQLHPTCGQCVFWQSDRTAVGGSAGHCHRHPPGVAINPATGTVVQKFPLTDRHTWCGEWSGDDRFGLKP